MTPSDDKPDAGGDADQQSHDMVRDAAAQLYAGALSDFITVRTGLVKTAKAEGQKEAAKEIAALRKPSVAAWTLNQLVHRDDPVIGALADLGSRLRRATAQLDAPAIAGLRGERDTVLADLVTAARTSSTELGQKTSAAVESEVRNTGIAALADEYAEAVLASGTLTRALSYSGFGEVDLSEAAATTSTGVVLTSIRGGRSAAKKRTRPEHKEPDAVEDDEADALEPQRREAGDDDAMEAEGEPDEVDDTAAAEDESADHEAGDDEAGDDEAGDDEAGDDEAGDDGAADGGPSDDGAGALAEAAVAEELERRREQATQSLEHAHKEVGRRRAALEAARNRTDATRQRVQKLEEKLVQARAEDDQALVAMAEAVKATKLADSDLVKAKDLLARLPEQRSE